MSKPKHAFRGKGRYLGHGYSTTDFANRPPKREFDYKDAISNEYHSTFRKTWHVERGIAPWKGAGRCDKHVSNSKRRPVVQKRLRKLNKYLKRAWKGYVFGRLPNTVHRRS